MIRDVGDLVTIDVTVRDSSNVATDATMVLVITKPDGSTTSPAPLHTGTGTYEATVTADQAGEWLYKWTASGTVTSVQSGQFSVAAQRQLVCSLQELKRHLRIATTTDDDELLDVIAAVTDIMEPIVGPVSPRVFTETLPTVTDWVYPRFGPIVSVASLTPRYGTALDSSAYRVDTLLGGVQTTWPLCDQHTIVYTAGHSPWPAALKLAGKIICQHEWQVRNGTNGRPSPDADALAMLPGSGFMVPNRAVELMSPYYVPAIC